MKQAIALIILLGLIAGGIYVGYEYSQVDITSPPNTGKDSVVYAKDNKVLGHIRASGGTQLKDEEVSSLVKQAHMAAEDRGFYTHGAVSWPRMAFSVVTSLGSAGGSTIAQQYIKNAFLTREKSLGRKSKEIIYAYKLMDQYTPDQVLVKYVNTIPYGRGTFGVEDAAKTWFGISATELKDINDPLQVARAAFLAALVQRQEFFAASKDKPSNLVNIDALNDRIRYVLDGLRKVEGVDQKDMVPQAVIDKAKQLLPLKVTDTVNASGSSADTDPYLLDYVKDWLTAWQIQVLKNDGMSDSEATAQGESASKALLARGGLAIHTSIDSNLQNLVAEAVQAKLPKTGLSAGVVILDPRTGAVAAMYGGKNHVKDGFNYALYANRQVGSTMKTVVLADAVSHGISVQSVLPAPAYIKINGAEIYNDDRKAAPGCKLSLADAMAVSNNPVHIELISGKMASCDNPAALSDIPDYPISPASVAALAHKLGADDSLVPGKTSPAKLDEVPSLALGVSSLTPLKLASIGGTYANGGVHNKPHIIDKIDDSNEENVYENETQSNRVLQAKQAGILNQVLTGVFTKGTARGAQVQGHPLAGKTGTTDTDAWMLAYSAVDPKNDDTPAYVCSAWAGYADNRTTSARGGDVWGADVAKICQYFFAGALKGTPTVNFPAADMNAGKVIGLQQEKPVEAPKPQPTTAEPAKAKPTPTTTEEAPTTTKRKPPATTTEQSTVTPSSQGVVTGTVDPGQSVG
ncbi:MAG TPA: transglycosylase domain-containing protein [Candidatus Saccharimonadales bacterium]|nr:transglycosylase domain-containing protein [Candidatus Saccharimonadales bacterium]